MKNLNSPKKLHNNWWMLFVFTDSSWAASEDFNCHDVLRFCLPPFRSASIQWGPGAFNWILFEQNERSNRIVRCYLKFSLLFSPTFTVSLVCACCTANSNSVLIERVILHRKFNKHNWKALPYGSVLYADSSRYLCRRLLKLPTACDSFSTLNDMSTGNKIRWKFASAVNYLGNNQKKKKYKSWRVLMILWTWT